MKRLALYDVSRSFRKPTTKLTAQIVFGGLCAIAMIALRSMIDIVAATAGPFALVYPTVLLATLYGRWQAGLTAFVLSIVWAWYFVLPTVGSFYFELETDRARVIINALAIGVVLIFAEGFRHAGSVYAEQRDAEIERRKLLLDELDHRTKNNFALSVSLLELQRRRIESPEAAEALDQAIGRLHSFASAYSNLNENQGEGAFVDMPSYLDDVVSRFRDAALDDRIAVDVSIAAEEMPRSTAVAIGLFTNEALTNCAKYAFAEDAPGTITVNFDQQADRWALEILDNGSPAPEIKANVNSSGLGTRLFQAFAAQANAEYSIDLTDAGCRVRLTGETVRSTD